MENETRVLIDEGTGEGFHIGTEEEFQQVLNNTLAEADQDDDEDEESSGLDLKSTLIGGAAVGVITGVIIGGRALKRKWDEKKLQKARELVAKADAAEAAEKAQEESEPEEEVEHIEGEIMNPPVEKEQ